MKYFPLTRQHCIHEEQHESSGAFGLCHRPINDWWFEITPQFGIIYSTFSPFKQLFARSYSNRILSSLVSCPSVRAYSETVSWNSVVTRSANSNRKNSKFNIGIKDTHALPRSLATLSSLKCPTLLVACQAQENKKAKTFHVWLKSPRILVYKIRMSVIIFIILLKLTTSNVQEEGNEKSKWVLRCLHSLFFYKHILFFLLSLIFAC